MTDIEEMLAEIEREVARLKKEQEEEKENNEKNEKGIKIAIGGLAGLLIIASAAYIITRESKRGQVRTVSNTPTSSMTGSNNYSKPTELETNVVVEPTSFPTTSRPVETEVVIATEPKPVETEAVIVTEPRPVETENVYTISQEDFENLVSRFIAANSDKLLSVETGDIVKFAALTNIDEIHEGNPELAEKLFSSNSSEEYFNDAFKVISALEMYNNNIWYQNRNTDNFIKVSDLVFDSQKDKMEKIENYVNDIANAVNANDEYLVNELVSEFLNDMNSGSLSKLDDGVGFASQVYIALIADGIAKDYLNQENFDMLQILKGSDKYISNMFALCNGCNSNGKTLGR